MAGKQLPQEAGKFQPSGIMRSGNSEKKKGAKVSFSSPLSTFAPDNQPISSEVKASLPSVTDNKENEPQQGSQTTAINPVFLSPVPSVPPPTVFPPYLQFNLNESPDKGAYTIDSPSAKIFCSDSSTARNISESLIVEEKTKEFLSPIETTDDYFKVIQTAQTYIRTTLKRCRTVSERNNMMRVLINTVLEGFDQ